MKKTQDNLKDKLKKIQKLKDFCQKLKDFRQKLNGPELLSTVMFQSGVKKKPGVTTLLKKVKIALFHKRTVISW